MAQAHCWYCGNHKKGGSALEMEAPCAECNARISEVEEIFDSPPQISVLLVARWFAYRDCRFFVVLNNDGRFSLHKGRCQIGIGNREMEPEIDTLKAFWGNTRPVGVNPRHGIKEQSWADCSWSVDYEPTTQDILLAINAHLIYVERFPMWDLPQV